MDREAELTFSSSSKADGVPILNMGPVGFVMLDRVDW